MPDTDDHAIEMARRSLYSAKALKPAIPTRTTTFMAIPRVFVSYSHDSQEHKKWVLGLATRLRNSGIDAILDQWELEPGDDLAIFMERQVNQADFVLMVCTERYVKKADAGEGGVGYEKMIATADLLANVDSKKIIPVVRQNGTRSIPTFLRTKLFVDFSHADDFEFSFDTLARAIHQSPLYVKPEVGNNPFESVDEKPLQPASDARTEIMKVITTMYDQGKSYKLSELYKAAKTSRILTEVITQELVEEGLIQTYSSGYFSLTDKGKRFAIEAKLV